MSQDNPLPTWGEVPEQVERYREMWDSQDKNLWASVDRYVEQESALEKLFKTYSKNEEIDEILIKVCALNQFYGTRMTIPTISAVARHIIGKPKIDNRLENGDIDVVEEIALVNVRIKKKQEREITRFYSFATKYCSFHRQDIYPIYDRYVQKILIAFNKEHNFYKFTGNGIDKNYKKFYDTMMEFRKHYEVENKSLKEIDKYLWLVGKRKENGDKIIL